MLQVLAHMKDRESRQSQRISQPSEGSEAFIERPDESKMLRNLEGESLN
jgi:hypothetical protein